MLLTEESSRDKAASSGPENQGSRRLAGAVQQSGMEGDYAQTSQNSGGAESFLLRRLAPRPMTPGRNTRNVWDFTVLRAYLHLGSTRYPRLWTMSSRNIFTEIDEIFCRLICGYYEWERRTIPKLLWRLRRLEPYGQMLFSKWKVNRHVTLKPLPLLDIEVQQRG